MSQHRRSMDKSKIKKSFVHTKIRIRDAIADSNQKQVTMDAAGIPSKVGCPTRNGGKVREPI